MRDGVDRERREAVEIGADLAGRAGVLERVAAAAGRGERGLAGRDIGTARAAARRRGGGRLAAAGRRLGGRGLAGGRLAVVAVEPPDASGFTLLAVVPSPTVISPVMVVFATFDEKQPLATTATLARTRSSGRARRARMPNSLPSAGPDSVGGSRQPVIGGRIRDVDDLDAQLLDRIQTELPLVERPYAALAEAIGSDEDSGARARGRAARAEGHPPDLRDLRFAPARLPRHARRRAHARATGRTQRPRSSRRTRASATTTCASTS